jgi:5-methylcytosine-specific restriction endonuclease McrA
MNAAAVLDEKVLVLNRMYAAVRVVSARRAFSLLCKQIAEVIAIDDGKYLNYDFESWIEIAEFQKQFEREKHDWVRTARIEIAVPKIIRLLGYDRFPKQMVKLNRRNLYARDNNRCQYCGMHFATKELTLDHVVPRVQGGEHTWENLVCACVKCNVRKGGRTPKQAGMKLVRKPVMPKRSPMLTIKLGNPKYASWKTFVDSAYWSVDLK